MKSDLEKLVLKKAKELSLAIIDWRRQIHANPELAYEEVETSRLVASLLETWGYEVKTNVAKTGVVGLLRGKEKKTLALRADMDALPIDEMNEVPYKSKVPGKMHACGHDAHVAMLLGAAKILSELKGDINGNIKLIFQPAEEGGNGALRMIEEGVLENPKVDAIFGIHVWSNLSSGTIGIKEGPLLAATGELKIKVKGKGGHGAHPEQAIDPIIVASSIVINMQSIVSRNVDPLEAAVISITAFNSGQAFNVIPEEATLLGTYRTMKKEIREIIKKRINDIVHGICSAYGTKCETELNDITPPTINHPDMSRLAKKVAENAFGKEKVVEPKPSMGGEDFAYYLERVPGAFLLLGTGNSEKGTDKPHHNPHFNVDEDVLWMGTALHALLALKYFEKDF